MKASEKNKWAIAEGYIPGRSHGPATQMSSHETACILNANDQEGHVHFNDLTPPEPLPRDTDDSRPIASDVSIIVRHSRLDSRQDANAVLSTVAYLNAD